MPKKGANISLSSYDDIFSTQESRQETGEHVIMLPLESIHPFKNHPFRIVDVFATFPVGDGNMAAYSVSHAFHGRLLDIRNHSLFGSNCKPQVVLKLMKLSCS